MLWAITLALFGNDVLKYLDEHQFELGILCASI